MECNKDEARKAKELAEKRIRAGDFSGAKIFASKAQKLYPELENIDQLVAVSEVHCSAQKKVNGTDMEWYGILQTDKFSKEEIVKKQYRKLALLLHPDKNNFPGSEAAFKLIGEAHTVLTDQGHRFLFDRKLKKSMTITATKQPARRQSNKTPSNCYKPQEMFEATCSNCGVSRQYKRVYINCKITCVVCQTSFIAYEKPRDPLFGAICCFCGLRHQYSKVYVNSKKCTSCHKNFIAYDLQHNHSDLQNWKGVASTNPPVSKAKDVGDLHVNCKPEAKLNQQKEDSVPGIPNGVGKKRKAKSVEESGNSVSRTCMVNKKTSCNATYQKPRTQKVLYEDSRSRSSSNFEEETEAAFDPTVNGDGILAGLASLDEISSKKKSTSSEGKAKNKDIDCRDSKAENSSAVNDNLTVEYPDSAGNEKNSNGFDSLDEILQMKKTVNDEDGKDKDNDNDFRDSKVENSSELKENVSKMPVRIEFSDPEFNYFDKSKNSFDVNQIWALYDEMDGMPRAYASVKKVFSPEFKLQIALLESDPKYKVEQVHAGCGKYVTGSTIYETDDILRFSHLVDVERNGFSYVIYPKKGEIWAVFKDWDINRRLDPKQQKQPYRLEYVLVLSDFVEYIGIAVLYLCKVKGSRSLFRRSLQRRHIRREDIYRFSHQVPSVRMTGKEKKGVPAGVYELDPASMSLGVGDDHED